MTSVDVLAHAGVVPMFGWSDLNPLDWASDAASEVAAQTWTTVMSSIWSGGLWLLKFAFTGVDSFTSPDLAASGPMGKVYPYTFGIGLAVALIMAFAQIGLAAFRRDGATLGRVLVGAAQYAVVWAGTVAVSAALVSAASGLTHGLLSGLLHIDGFGDYQAAVQWPRNATDTATATVLGLSSMLLVWPAALAYLLVMLVREAALLLLVATSPISAGGLLSDVGSVWLWKSLRWFLASLLIAPLAALVLGVGHQIALGVASGAGASDTTNAAATTGNASAVGMAVVGSVLVLVGALCPLLLFRLLAFVDPGTSNGSAFRTSLASQGGLRGLLSRDPSGSASASQGDGAGRSSGEATADLATQTRFTTADAGSAPVATSASSRGAIATAGGAVTGGIGAAALGALAAASAVGRAAQGAVNVSSDVLSSAGVGHAAPYYPPYEPNPTYPTAAPPTSKPARQAPANREPVPPASPPIDPGSAEAGLLHAG